MGCKGLHCGGCHGGGGPAAAVITLLVIIVVALRKAWPQILHAAEIAAWTVAGITGAAIVVTGGILTARVARRSRARRAVQQVTAPVIPAARLIERPTIEPPDGRRALGQSPRRQPRAWPLPGCWADISPRIGDDGRIGGDGR